MAASEALAQGKARQAAVYSLLIRSVGFRDPWVMFRDKLVKFISDISVDDWHKCQINTCKLIHQIPPKIWSSYYLTINNAWCTPSRFGQRTPFCSLCKKFVSTDDLKHYAVCEFLKKVAQVYLGIPTRHKRRHFFVLEDEAPILVACRLIHLHAARRAFDYARHGINRQDPNYTLFFERHYKAVLIKLWSEGTCNQFMQRALIFRTENRDSSAASSASQESSDSYSDSSSSE